MSAHTKIILIIFIAFKVGFEGSRLIPLEYVAFRPWEPLVENANSMGAFKRNKSVFQERSFGDLANMANLAAERRYRNAMMSTDECGARRQSFSLQSDLDGYYFGSSFGAGAAVNDDETITEVIYKTSGYRFYNLASAVITVGTQGTQSNLAANPNLRRRIVVIEVLERETAGYFRYMYLNAGDSTGRAVSDLCNAGSDQVSLWKEFSKRSPRLSLFSQQVKKVLQNDVILPNPFKDRVLTKSIGDQDLLFYEPELQREHNMEELHAVVEVLVEIGQQWKRRAFTPIFLFAPDKAEVNNHLLKEPFEFKNPNYLRLMETALLEAGFDVVNPVREMKAATRPDHLLYPPDDTHWNSEGTRLVAELLKNRLLEVATRVNQK